MDNAYLQHHGVLGMKWGVRRYQNKDGTLTNAGKKRYNKEMEKLKGEEKVLKNKQRTKDKIDKLESKRKDIKEQKKDFSVKEKVVKKATNNVPKKRSIKDLSDEELRAKKERLQLEKDYKDLLRSEERAKISKGQKFVSDVLEASGKNIATQATTYVMGKGVNALLESIFNEPNAINPKKGQKDK